MKMAVGYLVIGAVVGYIGAGLAWFLGAPLWLAIVLLFSLTSGSVLAVACLRCVTQPDQKKLRAVAATSIHTG